MFAFLNPEQQKAIQAIHGKVLILAGAGSGKTSVLACRIAHLIEHHQIPPQAILGLTFTNKAAKEMRERVARFTNPKAASLVHLCTFHSFCMQFLRKEIHHLGFTATFSLYDEHDVKRVLTHIVRHSLEHEGELPSLQSTLQKITHSQNLGQRSIIPDTQDQSWYSSFTKDLLHRLHTCMRSYNAVDFNGLLTLTTQILEEFPQVRKRYQHQYQYLLIDEYQDTNPVQYQLADLLSQHHGNLCVVGDDDQSIYGWRGAEVKNILHFPYDTQIKLEQNYRSTSHILHTANHLIAHNKERHDKALWSAQETGEPIILFHAPSEIEEAQSIAQRILWYRKHYQLQWKDFAILYRSNALSRSFETALLQAAWEENGAWKRSIPYEVFGGTEFYERAEVKDLLSYLRVLANPQDEEALLRIVNVPRRGISEKCLDALTQHQRQHQQSLWDLLQDPAPLTHILSQKALQGISTFTAIMQQAKQNFLTLPMQDAFTKLIEAIDYKKAIKEEAKSDKMREFKWDHVMSCIDAIASYEEEKRKDPLDPIPSLQDFLGCTLLQTHAGPKKTKNHINDKVHLMTIHSAKGLEFDVCFIVGMEDHLMPHEKSYKDTGLEEERRLLYVAITRAKKHLIFSMSRERRRMGKITPSQPSRFLFEIPKDRIKIVSYQTIDMS